MGFAFRPGEWSLEIGGTGWDRMPLTCVCHRRHCVSPGTWEQVLQGEAGAPPVPFASRVLWGLVPAPLSVVQDTGEIIHILPPICCATSDKPRPLYSRSSSSYKLLAGREGGEPPGRVILHFRGLGTHPGHWWGSVLGPQQERGVVAESADHMGRNPGWVLSPGSDVGAMGCGGCRECGGLIAADALPASTAKVISSSQSSLPPMTDHGRAGTKAQPLAPVQSCSAGPGRPRWCWLGPGRRPSSLCPALLSLPTGRLLAYDSGTQCRVPEA